MPENSPTPDPSEDEYDVLALTETLPDGGLLYQSWPIHRSILLAMRERLGPPQHESMATAEQAEATRRAVLSVDSGTHVSEDL